MKNQLWIEEGAATPPPTDGDGRRWRRGEWNKLSFRRDRRPPCLHVLSDPHPIYPTTFTRSYFNPVRGRPPCSSSSSTSSPSLHSNPTPAPLCRPSSIRGYTHSPDKRVRRRSERASSFPLGRPQPWSPLSAKRRSRSRVRCSVPALI